MNQVLLRGFNWCKRFKHRRGYGVHSPSDFFLITFVIYENLPFYAYSSLHHLRRLVAHLHGHREKTDKLFFRLINYLKPGIVLEFGTGSGMTTRYMSEANSNMEIYTFSDYKDVQVERLLSSRRAIHYLKSEKDSIYPVVSSVVERSVLYHIAHTANYREIYCEILKNVKENDFLIVSHPYSDKEKMIWWKEIINDECTGVTFDLYDIGIVFFDKKRVKENRVVNFL